MMHPVRVTLFNLIYAAVLVATQAPSSPGKYSHVGCYGKLPPPMYNMDGASGHKLLTGNAFTRTNTQAINECFNVAQAEHAEHFGLSMKSCYIQWPSTANYAANGPSSTCTNGVGSFMAIDVYKNLMYTPPPHQDIFTVSSHGKDFVVLNETSFNYMQSIVSCTNFGMTLAELNTAREISDLKAGLKMKFPNITGKNFWLHMDRSGGTPYTWRTTNLLVPTQGVNQDWASGNPNGVATPNYDCGAMIGSQDLKWITDNCKSHVNIPICEKNGTVSPTTTQSANPAVPTTHSANSMVPTKQSVNSMMSATQSASLRVPTTQSVNPMMPTTQSANSMMSKAQSANPKVTIAHSVNSVVSTTQSASSMVPTAQSANSMMSKAQSANVSTISTLGRTNQTCSKGFQLNHLGSCVAQLPLSTVAIVLLVLGGLIALVATTCCIVLCCRRRRQNDEKEPDVEV